MHYAVYFGFFKPIVLFCLQNTWSPSPPILCKQQRRNHLNPPWISYFSSLPLSVFLSSHPGIIKGMIINMSLINMFVQHFRFAWELWFCSLCSLNCRIQKQIFASILRELNIENWLILREIFKFLFLHWNSAQMFMCITTTSTNW